VAVKPDLKIVASRAESPPETPEGAAAPEQVEMPFAMVHGEPITQMPKDLYIPPQALEVFLEAFEGPLDLLLYMIRRQGLNILDIPIAEITKQYMDYIGLMQELQLELAGEYLVMAATLAEIKSRMLLPRANEGADGEELDPRADLVRRLQEYERFKRAAENIDRLPRLERDTWVATADFTEKRATRPVPQVALQEMLLAFRDVVQRAELFAHHHVQRERLSVRARMSDILASLEKASFLEFTTLFRPEEGRMGVTVTFVAILELMREGLLDIVQTEPYAPLHVRGAGGHRGLRLVADNDTVEAAPDATEADQAQSASAEPAMAQAADFDDSDEDLDDDLDELDDIDLQDAPATSPGETQDQAGDERNE
jgi:segregation and condensation protein A